MYAASASAPGGAAVHEPSGCLCLEPAMAVRARGEAGSAWRAPTPWDLTSVPPMLALPIAGTLRGRGGSIAGEGGGGGRAATRGEPRGEGAAVEARGDGTAVEARGGGQVGQGLALASAPPAMAFLLEHCAHLFGCVIHENNCDSFRTVESMSGRQPTLKYILMVLQ